MKTLFALSLFCFPLFAEYHSQKGVGQDKYLNEEVFKNKKGGVFVDIGAYDGVSLSNTYFFEKEMGWSGVCIEPNPKAFQKLKKARSSICVNGCISDSKEPARFLLLGKDGSEIEMLSGLLTKYDPRHLGRIKRESELGEDPKAEVITVPCFLLQDILKKQGISKVDYLSLDTEGGELEILKTIDFSAIDIDIIDVENNYGNPAFKTFLESKGFVLIKKLEQDEIYKKKREEKKN
jgi:FkbM family methyltransferase